MKVFEGENFRKRWCSSMMFAWCVIYPTRGKHSREREHPLSTLRYFSLHVLKN